MIIAGPCSVEGENFIEIALEVKRLGATHLRGGIFKPRSSPKRFNGLGIEGLEFVVEAKKQTGLPFVSEAMSPQQIEILYDYVDIFQIGTRNQTASELLREFGRQDKPVILKRGMATTIEEFVMYADYIMVEGNENVILCERGIRTFENYTRNTFDLSCIPAVKQLCDLPIIADPSHAVGRRELVVPVAKGAISAGADGLLIEVHDNPEMALTDSAQSITFEQFEELMRWQKLQEL
jgi:3-deoxy-7-phosphoheptulonate synthase